MVRPSASEHVFRLKQSNVAAWLHRISDVAPSSAEAAAVYQHPAYEQPWDSGKEAEVRRPLGEQLSSSPSVC